MEQESFINQFDIDITASDVDIKFHIDYHVNDYDL